jgi:methylated-DNA-[protein]-cysteine S-methyltransferase
MAERHARAFAIRRAPLGWLGVAWGEHGLVRVLVAEPDAVTCARRLETEHGASAAVAPSHEEGALLDALVAVLEGEASSLDAVVLDERGLSPFRRTVAAEARRLRAGEVVTYGALAVRVGSPGAARAVGSAMAANPFPLVVPCHRVVASGGRLGGFSLPGGEATKRWLLEQERVRLRGASERPADRERASEAQSR